MKTHAHLIGGGFVLLLLGSALIGCGYQFTGRVVEAGRGPSREVMIITTAIEPGLPLMVQRGLTTHGTRHGIRWRTVRVPTAETTLITVERVVTTPASVVRVETGGDAMGAVDYQAQVSLSVSRRIDRELLVQRFEGLAMYRDQGLGAATEAARRAALERATGDACAQLVVWLLTDVDETPP